VSVQDGNRRPVGEDDIEQLIDGRLPPERLEAVRRFLAEHPAQQARVAVDEALRIELRRQLDSIAAEAIPSRLRVATLLARRNQAWRRRLGTAAAAVALLAVGLGAGWQVRGWQAEQWRAGPQQPAPRLAEASDAIAAHRVFVVETAHPVEVGVAQQAHLVQWLSRRVGHPLRAPDLSGQGYRLMGGRVLPAEREAAAQFMYERGEGGAGNRLTLYVCADGRADTAFRFADADGFAAFSWIDAGLGFALVAPLDRPALLAVAEAAYQQLTAPAGATAPSATRQPAREH